MIAGLWNSAQKGALKVTNDTEKENEETPETLNHGPRASPAPEPIHEPAPEAATPDADIADTGLVGLGLPPPVTDPAQSVEGDPAPEGIAAAPRRPPMKRESSTPAPPVQPPPATPGAGNRTGQAPEPTDSLSLMQLKRIVAELPKNEPMSYAYEYADTGSFEEEIDEWFSYGTTENNRISRAKIQFGTRWRSFSQKTWTEEPWGRKKEFVKREVEGLAGKKGDNARRKAVARLMHVALGVWEESAGIGKSLSLTIDHEQNKRDGEPQVRSQATKCQIDAMKDGVRLVAETGGVRAVFDTMRKIVGVRDDEYGEARDASGQGNTGVMTDEIDNIMTVMYVLVEVTRNWPEEFKATKDDIVALEPNLLEYMLNTLAQLRWDDCSELPQNRIFNLFWKSLLLIFGNMTELDDVKAAVAESLQQEGRRSELITASPLDYHIFRQEIISKYPAYIPPVPLIPLDADDNNILPSLHTTQPRNNSQNGIMNLPSANSGGSILHQPVHIATPAPSPPPSPAMNGKAGKKQNYQTNQNFPFMYPPLDSTSNSAGGKGEAGAQAQLVGRKWEGSEIPASILEAGELFAKRTKMTRAMRQLWDEREAFLKHERGYGDEDEKVKDLDDLDMDVDEYKLEEELMKRLERIGMEDEEDELEDKGKKVEIDTGPRDVSDEVRHRLEVVETFFEASLPHLGSLVVVLLKAILFNVTALLTQPNSGMNAGLQSAHQSEFNLRSGVPAMQRQKPAQGGGEQQYENFVRDLPIDEVEALRQREISLKAVSGILLTLLKWFKVSHIRKFEYLSQLLLDANYLPLVLKFFVHADVDKLIDIDCDRPPLSFFGYCNRTSKQMASPNSTSPAGSRQPPVSSATAGTEKENSQPAAESTDEDDAVPPPIRISRSSNPPGQGTSKGPRPIPPPNQRTASAIHSPQLVPKLDENGRLIPSTSYSARNFLSSINLLRVMHKITDGKTHRLLLLVQYKSSAILRKALKVPDPMLKKYTLKLFKGQVPFCGRKWRQGNMRVITQVYLDLRPQLRDEWLSGGEIERGVEESQGVEQAGRALVGWGLGRRYKDILRGRKVGATGEEEVERDWFHRELEKMSWRGADQNEEVDWEDEEGMEPVDGILNAGPQWTQGGKWTPGQ